MRTMHLDNLFIYILHIRACERFVHSTRNRLSKAEVPDCMEITIWRKEIEVNNLTVRSLYTMLHTMRTTPQCDIDK